MSVSATVSVAGPIRATDDVIAKAGALAAYVASSASGVDGVDADADVDADVDSKHLIRIEQCIDVIRRSLVTVSVEAPKKARREAAAGASAPAAVAVSAAAAAACAPALAPAPVSMPFIVAQTVTTAGKCPTYLFPVSAADAAGAADAALVLKGPMNPAVAALVQRRCSIFQRPSWCPWTHLQWTVHVDTHGLHWLVSRNVDARGRLPQRVQWSRVYHFVAPAFTGGFYGGGGSGGSGGSTAAAATKRTLTSVWAWKGVRGSLPADSGARRVKDVLDSGEFPGPAVLRNLFVHLSLRYVLGCGDSGFHNCLIGGGVDAGVDGVDAAIDDDTRAGGIGMDFEDYRGGCGVGVGVASASASAPVTVMEALAPRGKLGVKVVAPLVADNLRECSGHLRKVLAALDVDGLEDEEVARRDALVSLLDKGALL
jgi:hypothetical protein